MNESSLEERVDVSTQLRYHELKAAQGLAITNRKRGLAALNDIFRRSDLPDPPHGRYRGELVALDIAPGLTQLFNAIAASWMPWLGKTFDAAGQSGDNIFSRDSYPLARFFNPLYRDFTFDGSDTYRGFSFRTYTAPGLMDPDRTVLKIDYNLDENPSLTVRRVLDELVQLESGTYLGKAHLRWWWGSWQTVAYFVLSR